MRYSLHENLTLKGSYTRMMQYIHLVANSGASLPTDIWYPSNRVVRPQRSHQVALGLSQTLGKSRYLITNELYLEKQKGRTTGWIGYTLSWTYRRFDQINGGRWFPTRYDRRHDVSIVLLHKLWPRLHATATWVYGTGNAFSVPVGRIFLQGQPGVRDAYVPIYTERNAFRLAPYHRLDLGLVFEFRPKQGERDLTLSIYNAYNRRNPYFVYFEELEDKENNVTIGFQGKQVSLFPIIPALTYNFRF